MVLILPISTALYYSGQVDVVTTVLSAKQARPQEPAGRHWNGHSQCRDEAGLFR